MIGRWAGLGLGLLALAGCAETLDSRPGIPGLGGYDADYQRGFEQVFTEQPFRAGSLQVVADEGDGLSTYTLVPCRPGVAPASICLGSARGPAGQVSRTPDWFVVRGLAGRTFWLSYGGDGYVERAGTFAPLAWDARRNGTGPGTVGSLETPYPHPVEP